MLKNIARTIGFLAAVFGLIQGIHWGYIEVMKKVKEPLSCLPLDLTHRLAKVSGVRNEPARGNLFITPQGYDGKSTVQWRVDLARDCSYQMKLQYSIHEPRPLKVTIQHQENLNWGEATIPQVVSERAFQEFQHIGPEQATHERLESVPLKESFKLKKGRNWITLETIDTPLPHIDGAVLNP